jgi:hypothetical protein
LDLLRWQWSSSAVWETTNLGGTVSSSVVQREYQARMDALSARERIERSLALFQWSSELLARRVAAEQGPMSAERLKWEVALRQYGADPAARALILRKLADVPR